MDKAVVINSKDNVAVATEEIEKGSVCSGVTALDDIPFGHKIALRDIPKGSSVVKYGFPIGHTLCDIKKGSLVREHNLKTNLSDKKDYVFNGSKEYNFSKSGVSIDAYRRKNGDIGIRNEIWIIPTVGCVNKTAQVLQQQCENIVASGCDGIFAYTHPFGCSQMGDDLKNTQKILASLVKHPNAGGVLVLSLGCENNNLNEFIPLLGDYDRKRVRFLCAQNVEDEIAEGKKIIGEIYDEIKNDKREKVGIENLKLGFKCGGSDAFSGITANPLCGCVNDILTSYGASGVLTEVPEMFGAEQILMDRCLNREVYDKLVAMITGFKEYFSLHNQVCYENPSPGNHEGGITTLEEKSLGCVQKGGSSTVCDVLSYGESIHKNGLSLLWGPGNDIVSVTNLTAAGVHLILFTTGRGTSLGAPVPTLKISTNTPLYLKKSNWIDFNAGELIETGDFDKLSRSLVDKIICVASGEKTKNEINGYRDISILKDGVVM